MQAWDDHGGDDVEVYGFVSAKVLLCILVQATKAPSDEWDRDDPVGEAVEAWVGVLNSKVLCQARIYGFLCRPRKSHRMSGMFPLEKRSRHGLVFSIQRCCCQARIRILVQATKEPSDEWDVPAGEDVEAWVGVGV